ncbi:MAG: hypothetical protein AAB462_04455 [Patescibacteria group bacterium]
MATEQASGVENLTTFIDELGPDQVEREIGSILGSRSDVMLANMTAAHGIDSTVQVLESVKGALERTGIDFISASLGSKAVNAIAGSARSSVYGHDVSASTVIELSNQASRFAEMIGDPEDRARAYIDIAASLNKTREKTASTASQVFVIVNKAAESARKIENVGDRAYVIAQVAEESAKSVESLGSIDPIKDVEIMQSATAVRTIQLYEAATEAASNAPIDLSESHKGPMLDVVLSIARSAAKVSEANPLLEKELIDLVVTKIKDIISSYNDEGVAKKDKILPARKATKLTSIGSYLAQTIDDDYKIAEDGDSSQRSRLVDSVLDVFEAAHEEAKIVGSTKKSFFDTSKDKYNLRNAPSSLSMAAYRLVKFDLEAGERAYTIAFNMAAVKAKFTDYKPEDDKQGILNRISNQAKEQADLQSAFRLFALSHKLDKESLAGGISHHMGVNARQFMQYDYRGDLDVKLDTIDHEFVEWVIKIGSTDKHTSWSRQLALLDQFVEDPKLKADISEGVAALRARDKESRRPKSEAERLVREVLHDRV